MVEVIDNGFPYPLSTTNTVTVSIIDVNEEPTMPHFDLAVNENYCQLYAPNFYDSVFDVEADGGFKLIYPPIEGTDVDIADNGGGGWLSYEITGGQGADKFTLEQGATIGNEIYLAIADDGVVDYEDTSSYAIEITVTDLAGLSSVGTVNVEIVNVSAAWVYICHVIY